MTAAHLSATGINTTTISKRPMFKSQVSRCTMSFFLVPTLARGNKKNPIF
jgi:hypothetical protein